MPADRSWQEQDIAETDRQVNTRREAETATQDELLRAQMTKQTTLAAKSNSPSADRERLVQVAPGVWQRVGEYPNNGGAQTGTQMSLADWKQRDYAAIESYQEQQAAAQEVTVPSFWSNPMGWLQAKLINAGRKNETIKDALVGANNATNKLNEFVAQIIQEVPNTVLHSPSWLSISYQPQLFSLGNYTVSHGVSYDPLAQNLLQSVTYQQMQVEVEKSLTLTINPNGWLDVDFSDGTITFNGKDRKLFIQPGALSFGWSSGTNPIELPEGLFQKTVKTTTVDLDLLGKNWCSLKVSHATGPETTRMVNIDETKVEVADSSTMKVTINVHRWPRIVAMAGGLYFVWEVGVAALGVVANKIPALIPLLGSP